MKKQNAKKWILIALLVLIVAFGAAMNAGAANGTPGSSVDPVVTKSYVDKTVKESAASAAKEAAETAAKAAVSAELDATVTRLEEAAAESCEETISRVISESGVTADSSYEVLFMQAGSTLLGKESTEIIVRSGSAKVVASGENGLCDLTSGADVGGGKTAETNHLLLCPRDDGRGIFAATDIWVMVKGKYSFQ